MNKYRMNVKLNNPVETLEYHFAARTEELAKKYFLYQMYKRIASEELIFDRIHISPDGFAISAVYEKKVYLSGRLYCVPNRCKIIDVKSIEQMSIKQMQQRMGSCCHSLDNIMTKESW